MGRGEGTVANYSRGERPPEVPHPPHLSAPEPSAVAGGPALETALNFRVAVPSWSFEGTEGFSLRVCDSDANFSYALREPKSHPCVLIRGLPDSRRGESTEVMRSVNGKRIYVSYS
jgi:hypothetical protein